MSGASDESTSEPYVSDSCVICDKQFPSDLLLAKHLMRHSKEEEFKILVKEFEEKNKSRASSFTATTSKNVSYKSKSLKKPSNVNICDEIVIDDDSDDEKPITPKASIPLRSVRIVNSSTKQYAVNQKTIFQCPVCSKHFISDVNLRNHMLVHEKEKPYTCSFCNKSFSYMGRYRSHMELHEKEKKYQSKTSLKN